MATRAQVVGRERDAKDARGSLGATCTILLPAWAGSATTLTYLLGDDVCGASRLAQQQDREAVLEEFEDRPHCARSALGDSGGGEARGEARGEESSWDVAAVRLTCVAGGVR